LQNEITSEAAVSGTSSRPEFYRKNQKWSEGLISASKDIGRGAKLLVDSANAVVNEQVNPLLKNY
jgi:huntingtin interacting protein 1